MAKTKSKRNASERLIKKTAKSKSVNPFDVRVNRQKFEVLGRKSKNDRGLPGVARAKSIKKRKETLLQEYKVKDKVNKFLDRRIGENNSAMTQEDRIMARYTAERIKSHNKKTLFNLADDEVLTHRGKTLSEIEKYDDPGSEDEQEFEEKGGGLEADIVESHFGGGIFREKEDGAKTHATLIDELITESKKRKAERQRAKEHTLELTDKLDAEWHELLPIVGPGKAIDDVEQKPEKGSYDQLMRELKFESRGVPSDRLKSADEVAKEEKEKLEKLEEERLKRMKGLDEVSTSVLKHRSADDLDDGFEIEDEIVDDNPLDSTTKSEEGATSSEDSEQDDEDEEEEEEECEDGAKDDEEQKTEPKNQLPIGIEKNMEDKNTISEIEESKCDNDDEEVEKDDDDDDDDGDDLSDLKHNSDDDNDDADDLCKDDLKPIKEDGLSQSKDLEVHPNEKIDNKEFMDALMVKKQQMEDARKELPYTFELPESYEELERVMEGRSVDQQGVIVERIIKCHHPSLGDNNKLNLEKLFVFLLQLLNDAEDDDVWKLLDRLAPHLFDLTQFSPENSAHSLLEVLNEKHEDFKKQPYKFPETNTLVFLKLVPLLFPSSDVRHRVTTPAFVFLLQILNQCKVRSRRGISKGLFVVTMLLEYTALSNKYSPETVNFLQGVLEMAVSGEPVSLLTCKADWNVLVMDSSNKAKNYESYKLSYFDLTAENVHIDDNFRLSTLYTLIRLLSVLCSQLENIPSFKIIFSRITGLLNKLEVSKYPSSLRDEISNLKINVNKIFNKKLQFVVLEKKKPKALRLFEPQIVKVYEGRKRKDIPEEKAEQQKLLAKYKKEMKGALREIRRDNAFLTKVKLQQQARSDEDRRRKVKQIYSWGAAQEGEFNKLKRKKKH